MEIPLVSMKDAVNRVLEEATGHAVTVELNSGEQYTGTLVVSEGNMNLQLSNVTHISRQGHASSLAEVYIRGSHIVMVHLPEMLQYAPAFQPAILEQSHAIGQKRKR